jgi:hypothetical protein
MSDGGALPPLVIEDTSPGSQLNLELEFPTEEGGGGRSRRHGRFKQTENSEGIVTGLPLPLPLTVYPAESSLDRIKVKLLSTHNLLTVQYSLHPWGHQEVLLLSLVLLINCLYTLTVGYHLLFSLTLSPSLPQTRPATLGFTSTEG